MIIKSRTFFLLARHVVPLGDGLALVLPGPVDTRLRVTLGFAGQPGDPTLEDLPAVADLTDVGAGEHLENAHLRKQSNHKGGAQLKTCTSCI